MKKSKTLTRRNFTALGSIAALGMAAEAKGNQEFSQTDIVYKSAIPEKVSDRAYRLFQEGSCMYAAVKSIWTLTLAKPVPMHYDLFKYGHGGCGGQGSLCGACNGAAAVIGSYVQDKKECDALIAKVFSWYETTNLPVYKPVGFDGDNVTSASGSILCHVSMTKWCEAADKSPFSTERKNRCARLTADTAAKTVEILNEYFSGSQKTTKQVSSEKRTSCAPCHTVDIQSGPLSKGPKVKVKMNCSTCHPDAHHKGS
jgi:hypothetical protein